MPHRARFAVLLMVLTALPAGLRAASPPERADVPVFPGAEGFGRLARGGRGGDVYHVTTLDDAGPGSLREGIASAQGPRTIVFDVGGEIRLKSALTIGASCLTIAGQTAPGDGITIRDYSVQIKDATDVVLRYLRLRLGDDRPPDASGADDALVTDDIRRVIVDHCSLSWDIDGTHDLRRGGDFTLQWCIISEALNRSLHSRGAHAMAASYRDLSGPITLHHNLIATCRDRHPSLGSAQGPPRDVGGYPALRSAAAPADTDRDGIPDAWETDHGLDPNDPTDQRDDRNRDGYTNLEEFLNGV